MSVDIPVPRPMDLDPSWGPRYRLNQANEGLGPGPPGGCGEGFLNFFHEFFHCFKKGNHKFFDFKGNESSEPVPSIFRKCSVSFQGGGN